MNSGSNLRKFRNPSISHPRGFSRSRRQCTPGKARFCSRALPGQRDSHASAPAHDRARAAGDLGKRNVACRGDAVRRLFRGWEGAAVALTAETALQPVDVGCERNEPARLWLSPLPLLTPALFPAPGTPDFSRRASLQAGTLSDQQSNIVSFHNFR